MAVEFRPAVPAEEQRILAMDRICFPLDEPPSIAGAVWFIGCDGGTEAAYCAWKTVEHGGVPVGFHYRAGVLPGFRGQGLQRRMLRLREARMREEGLRSAVTYTDADGAASMRSLIAEGYRPYAPSPATTLSGAGRFGRVGFVHWRKSL
jgi:ribosomal protein S18 acetylase RimI-like enzyme